MTARTIDVRAHDMTRDLIMSRDVVRLHITSDFDFRSTGL